MMRMFRVLVFSLAAVLALPPAAAMAEPVFFDDFDDDDLLPHWNRPPDHHWEYEVSGGMLHVTDLFFPGDPHQGGNWALMQATFAAQTDFRADVRMGWEAGDDPHELVIRVKGPQGVGIASFGYSTIIAPEPVIGAGSGGSDFHVEPAPPPGIYHFTIGRTGGAFEFYFNGEPFASFPDRFGTPAIGLDLWFLGPNPGQLGAFHVDLVRVVPGPGVLSLLAGFALCCSNRRCARRARQKRLHSPHQQEQ